MSIYHPYLHHKKRKSLNRLGMERKLTTDALAQICRLHVSCCELMSNSELLLPGSNVNLNIEVEGDEKEDKKGESRTELTPVITTRMNCLAVAYGGTMNHKREEYSDLPHCFWYGITVIRESGRWTWRCSWDTLFNSEIVNRGKLR